MILKKVIIIFSLFILSTSLFADELEKLELLDLNDSELLQDIGKKRDYDPMGDLNLSDLEEIDDLNALKQDVGSMIIEDKGAAGKKTITAKKGEKDLKKKDDEGDLSAIKLDEQKDVIFDVGMEEKKLLELSKYVEGKIPSREWDEIATAAKKEQYVIQKGDWLWKISQKLFGSGFYYSKIWSLNSHITNPHEVEPGMTLVFDTGDMDTLPSVKLGEFAEPLTIDKNDRKKNEEGFDFDYFGDEVEPEWVGQRKRLKEQGVYFQSASQVSYNDIFDIDGKLSREYKNYIPPDSRYISAVLAKKYDSTGFDKSSRLVFNFKEGFYLNSFVTVNPVIDFGYIEALQEAQTILRKMNRFYVKFDPAVKVKAGDRYSVYSADGKMSHPVSDREGYRYTITGQLKTIKRINHVWECELLETTGIIQRGDRITAYTPKINRIIKTFNQRRIEAAFIGSHGSSAAISYGDVVFLDRGRSDGVELGNVFAIYSFHDRGTNRKITPDPTYKIGEITVITVTDNFSTALITNSKHEMQLGVLAITKSPEEAAESQKGKLQSRVKDLEDMKGKELEELDVELNLDDISDDLIEKADQIKLTEDELEELERQEKEKSIIKDHERDLKELERLEQDIVEAETKLKEIRVDEDKILEDQNLDEVEKKKTKAEENGFESLDELEKKQGRKYMDEDLNSMENPYGLTEFDIEEIDELLNTDSK